MLQSDMREPIRLRVWGCPWLRVACAVAGAVAGRGGACQSRIHSGAAIDLDLLSRGGGGYG